MGRSSDRCRRIELFMMIVGLLSRAQDAQLLASPSYLPDPSGYMSAASTRRSPTSGKT